MWPDQTQEHEFGYFYAMSIHSLFKNHLKFQNFNKVFHCDIAKRGHK